MVVAYPGAYNRALRPRQAAADDETGLFFFPSGSAVIAYEMATGAAVATLKGAQASLNACCWDAVYGRVLAGGQDGQWWAWEIGQRQAEETREDWGEADQDSSGDEDMWG